MYFPLSLGSEGSCTIGGNLSTNAGGTAVLRFGNARDLALGLEVVLRRRARLGRPARIAQGQHRLRPQAALHRRRGNARHHHRGGAEALSRAALAGDRAGRGRRRRAGDRASARRTKQALGDRLTGFELISDVRARPFAQASSRPARSAAGPSVVRAGPGRRQRRRTHRSPPQSSTRSRRRSNPARRSTRPSRSRTTQAAKLWALRENITEAQRREGPNIKHDISLPVSAIPAFLARARARAVAQRSRASRFVVFGHLGDGNLHYNLAAPEGADARDVHGQRRRGATGSFTISSHAHGGSISAEHGIGQLKRGELVALQERRRARADARGSRRRSTRAAS